MWLLLTFPLLLQWMRISAEDALPVYWNVPSASCKKMGVNIPLNEFEIIHNKGDEFLGEKIVIFYEKKFGKCPYYKDYDPKQPINGGLPQNVPIDEHLAIVEKQINEAIPDENFNGVAVIDIEEWRPLTFFMRTFKKAIELRPKALWGLYDFPFCNAKAGDLEGDFECSNQAQRYNDE
ncbi:hyaluronoglucosaminidase [Ancylostoma ceylanicum]|uniref:Hyaluronidase n=1 Tax=Ancylostoma ceylanicum TaxID=53326 RepID=A0A0D6M0H1_9BILA|nr:hyaluronoglucosaminidase [Ancylostoma ceylanicum]